MNFKFFVDNVVKREVVPAFTEFEGAKHIEVSLGVELQLDITVAPPANNIPGFLVKDDLAIGVRGHVEVEIKGEASQVDFLLKIFLQVFGGRGVPEVNERYKILFLDR